MTFTFVCDCGNKMILRGLAIKGDIITCGNCNRRYSWNEIPEQKKKEPFTLVVSKSDEVSASNLFLDTIFPACKEPEAKEK